MSNYTNRELAAEARHMAADLRVPLGIKATESSFTWAIRVSNHGASLVVTITPDPKACFLHGLRSEHSSYESSMAL